MNNYFKLITASLFYHLNNDFAFKCSELTLSVDYEIK